MQGRNSTVPLSHPVEVPEGDWALTLQTTVARARLRRARRQLVPGPGQLPASPLANGGAFGGKRRSPVPDAARALADATGDAVRLLWRREDVVRRGPKRPPLAVALRADGTGVVRVGRTERVGRSGTAGGPRAEHAAPAWRSSWSTSPGPPVSPDLRGAGWAEVLAARSRARRAPATAPRARRGARRACPVRAVPASSCISTARPRGRVEVDVWAGEILCPVTLRSYALGAVHQALGMVWSEGIAVDGAGEPVDLTIRSFGILAGA